jgi:hypothetical protein
MNVLVMEILHSHFQLSWDQVLALGNCFQMPLACIPPLIQETMVYSHIENWHYYCFYILIFRLLEKSREEA